MGIRYMGTDTNTGTSSDTSDTSSDTSSDSNTDNNSGNGSTCAAAWAQCGGQNFEGPTCCVSGYSCVASSQWYSQCKPTTDSADTNTNTNTDTSTDTSTDANVDVNTDANTNTGTNTAGGTCAAAWAQCGGQSFEGPTCCVSGYSCVASSQWYSQCKPARK